MIQASLVTADHSGEDAGDGETTGDRKGGAEAGQERVLGGATISDSATGRVGAATASARPAAAPPRPVKIAPATATLRLWPGTCPRGHQARGLPPLVARATFMSARVFGV